ANYISRYIRNRLATATVTSSSGAITLAQNFYDGVLPPPGLGWPPNSKCGLYQDPGVAMALPDSASGASFAYRGNLKYSVALQGNRCTAYQITGIPYQTVDGAGNSVSITADASYSLPSVLTPNGNSNLATSLTYSSFWAVQSVTGPNGASVNTSYDTFGRP